MCSEQGGTVLCALFGPQSSASYDLDYLLQRWLEPPVVTGDPASLCTLFIDYISPISPVFSPFLARFHGLAEAVPTSPKPEPTAKKRPAPQTPNQGSPVAQQSAS